MPSSPVQTGDMARLVDAFDWHSTSLGPKSDWSTSLRTLVSATLHSPQLMAVLWGPRHVIIYNDAFAKACGRWHPGALGRPLFEVWPNLAPEVVQHVTGAYQKGQSASQENAEISTTRSGHPQQVHYSMSYTPLHDDDGSIGGVLLSGTETSKVQTALLEANQIKYEFLAMLGHELRNPLAPIVTALGVMKMRDGTAFAKERAVIERQISHLMRLVDDLLDVSKITRGIIELRREHIELAAVVARAVEVAAPLFEEKRQKLEISVTPGLSWSADPARLSQVVSNLLTNAARYTPEGGHIWLEASEQNGSLRLTVRDTGAGIEASMLPRIFDVFYQGKQKSDRAEGGLGLGLALVKNLTAMHGGTVSVQSEGVGKGSQFTVSLPPPDTMGRVAAAKAAKSASQPKTASRKVLVVDDNVAAADMLKDMLELSGHSVLVSYTPLDALAKAGQFEPEFAVLDIGLPGMDGYELAVKLRESMPSVPMKMIALTGYGQESDHEKSKSHGFAAHVVKPIEMDELLALIEA